MQYSLFVLQRVFVPCLGEGVRPWDEWLPHEAKTTPTNTNTTYVSVKTNTFTIRTHFCSYNIRIRAESASES